MKKFMSLFLAMILSCSLIIPAMATSASNQNRTIDIFTTKMSVETNVDYYHKFDKNDPDSEQLVASEKVPYAISYMDMN